MPTAAATSGIRLILVIVFMPYRIYPLSRTHKGNIPFSFLDRVTAALYTGLQQELTMHVVIIGNGIAGINVASALIGVESVSVEVFTSEPRHLYSRIRLPEVLAGTSKPDEIIFHKPEWYEKKNITVHMNSPVTAIDPDGRTITLKDGVAVSWDYLVLATGASANHPPLPGADLAGVHTMRTMDDVSRIRECSRAHPETASVIGGGLLGLEAARALKAAGSKSVRVFEIAPRLLPRQLDETGAALLEKRFAAMGIEVLCGVQTEGFLPADDDPSRAGAVQLKDGRVLPSDLTLLSMGVHSNTDLAKDAGIAVNRGIVVDNRMRTSRPGIYAVGDCAEFDGIVWGIIPAALEQAPVAAKNILHDAGLLTTGEPPHYVQTVPQTALKVGEIELMSLGKAVLTPEETASGDFTELHRLWPDGSRYEKLVILSAAPADEPGKQKLLGAILYGSREHQAAVKKIMGSAVAPADLEALLE